LSSLNGIKELQEKMVLSSSLSRSSKFPHLTSPRSFGVYCLSKSSLGCTGRKFRFGNHPVRMNELEREFEKVELEGLFLDREDAQQYASLLNQG
jgi:hypothetical protein